MVKCLSTMWETWVGKIPWKKKKKMATHSSTLAWKSHGQRSLGQATIHGVVKRVSIAKRVSISLLTDKDKGPGSPSDFHRHQSGELPSCLGGGNSSGYLHGLSIDSKKGLSSLLMGQGKIPESSPLTLSQQAWGG